MECFVGHIAADIVFIILLGISEWMGHSKKIKDNSIYDWLHRKLKKLVRGE
jgi:hypothetical protein